MVLLKYLSTIEGETRVEAFIFDPGVYDNDVKGIIMAGVIPYKYVQFYLAVIDEQWEDVEFRDEF